MYKTLKELTVDIIDNYIKDYAKNNVITSYVHESVKSLYSCTCIDIPATNLVKGVTKITIEIYPYNPEFPRDNRKWAIDASNRTYSKSIDTLYITFTNIANYNVYDKMVGFQVFGRDF